MITLPGSTRVQLDNSDLDSTRTISVDDCFAVRKCFLHFIPFELANLILDAAMYWPSVTAERTDLLVITAGFANPKLSTYYLITPPIPQVVRDSVVLPTRIRMVKFTLQSCDQGFGGDSQNRGTYNILRSWLEASILRDVDPQKIDSLFRLGTVVSAKLDKASEDVEVGNPTDDGMTRHWHVQSNVVASPEVKRHEVVWRFDDVFTDKEESDAKAQGRGIGRGFISTLSCGDRVGLVARARYLWQNHVFGARIDIFYSV